MSRCRDWSGVGAVILAAGGSTRMGRHKGLLPWGDKPLLRYQVDVLCDLGLGDVAVVLGADVDDLSPLIVDDERVRTIWNARYASGRSSSVVISALALRAQDALMFCNVDQPVSTRLIEDLLGGASIGSDSTIAVAMQRGRRGHPILVRRPVFSELVLIEEASRGLKGVLRKDPKRVLNVPTDSPNAHLGFNTPEEYEHAIKRLRSGELEVG